MVVPCRKWWRSLLRMCSTPRKRNGHWLDRRSWYWDLKKLQPGRWHRDQRRSVTTSHTHTGSDIKHSELKWLLFHVTAVEGVFFFYISRWQMSEGDKCWLLLSWPETLFAQSQSERSSLILLPSHDWRHPLFILHKHCQLAISAAQHAAVVDVGWSWRTSGGQRKNDFTMERGRIKKKHV